MQCCTSANRPRTQWEGGGRWAHLPCPHSLPYHPSHTPAHLPCNMPSSATTCPAFFPTYPLLYTDLWVPLHSWDCWDLYALTIWRTVRLDGGSSRCLPPPTTPPAARCRRTHACLPHPPACAHCLHATAHHLLPTACLLPSSCCLCAQPVSCHPSASCSATSPLFLPLLPFLTCTLLYSCLPPLVGLEKRNFALTKSLYFCTANQVDQAGCSVWSTELKVRRERCPLISPSCIQAEAYQRPHPGKKT